MPTAVEKPERDLPADSTEIAALEERLASTQRALASRDAELARARQLLDDARREFDEFATIACHDLNAPLRGIATYCQILLKRHAEALDEAGLQRLRALPQLAQRAQDLLNTLHRYAELSSHEFEVAEISAEEVVAEALESLDLAAGDHGDTCVSVRRPLPAVECDHDALRSLFQILVTNALQYNESQPRHVTIGALDDSHPPTFFVQDDGIGISEDLREAVFQIFRRLHPADAYEGGLGAGLAIARKLVERHGGRIWVESSPGEGSRFCFDLGKSSG